jgi:hypothetical protein
MLGCSPSRIELKKLLTERWAIFLRLALYSFFHQKAHDFALNLTSCVQAWHNLGNGKQPDRTEREQMGNRSLIVIESERFQTPISLYGHWSGAGNLAAVAEVLGKTTRVGDPSYLTAQIFYEFAIVRGKYDGELSFGIDTFGVPDASAGMDTDTVFVNADTGAWSWQAFGLSSKTDTADGEPKVIITSCS